MIAAPLLEVRDLAVWFPVRSGLLRRGSGWIKAVDGVTFAVRQGSTLALVGESGSGKTTTARAIARIQEPTRGEIRVGGVDITALRGRKLRDERRAFQMVFQDPQSSLDPRQTIGSALQEPMRVLGLGTRRDRESRAAELLQLVGLNGQMLRRYPHEFSGGQRQRIGIARALAVQPKLLVCDEPVSALDVSIQAQIVNLLRRLQADLGLTYLFIAHDLAIVRHVADEVAVMYLGRIVEIGPSEVIYQRPTHPYTAALLSAVPIPDASIETSRRRIILKGDVPSPADQPSGCHFHPRCWLRERLGNPEICVSQSPPLRSPDGGGSVRVACHFAEETVVQAEGLVSSVA